jgi:drug/metabolite transporter (DMT)-like permease
VTARRPLLGGVPLMLLASAFFSAMFASVKALGPDFPYAEAVFFRSLFSLPLVALLLWRSGCSLRPRRPYLMLLRGLLGGGAMLGNFFALQRAKLADITVIGRTQPLLVAALAPLLLRERVPRLALLSLGVGFGGALLVVKPGPDLLSVNLPALVALGATLLSALAHLIIRRLNATDAPLVIVFYFTLIIGAAGGLLSVPVFVVPDARQLAVLVALAHFAALGQLLMTTAYGRETAPVVAAASYSSIAFTLVLGLIFWSELPDGLALAGAGIVVAAGLVLAFGRRNADGPAAG